MADINKTAAEVADILMTVDNATNGGVNTLVTSANIDDIPSNKIEKPSTEGSNGQVLTTNGAGGVSWTDKLNSTELTEAVSDWLDENVDPTGAAVIVDSTLTISGAAADAKVTGDELGTLRSAITSLDEGILFFKVIPDTYIATTGAEVPYNGWSSSDFVPVQNDKIIIVSRVRSTYNCFYDANKDYISGQNFTVNEGTTTVTVPENAKYFRLSNTSAAMANEYVRSNTYNKLDTLNESVIGNTVDIGALRTDVADLEDTAYVIRNITHTKTTNVIDFVQGIYTDTGAINTSLTDYYHSPMFYVKEGWTVSYTNLRTYGGWCLIACFDRNKNFLSSQSVISPDSNFKSGTFIVPAGVDYISITAYNPNTAEADPYEATIPELIPLNEIVESIVGAWNGKTAVIIGDSITDGLYTPTGGSSPDTRAYPIYWQTAGEIIGIGNFVGYGISGTSISRTSTTLPSYAMSIRYTEMINGADLVIVAGGTNDYGTNVALGTIADQTDVSFYGALNVLCDGLQSKYPGKRIVFITPIHRANEDANQVGATLEQYRQAIYDVARDTYGFAVIDGRTMGISCKNASFKNVYIYDGLHPTQEGHNVYGQALGHALSAI